MKISFVRPALGAALVLCVGCSSVPLESLRPEVTAVRPRIAGLDFGGVDLALDVDVRNPLPVPIRTPAFRYRLDVEGATLASSDAAPGLDLPAAGLGTATLPIRLTFADIARAWRSFSDAKEIPYRIEGALLLPLAGETLEIPLSHAGTMPVLRPPTFRLVGMDEPSVSITGVRVGLEAEVANPNAFALGLDGLGYALEMSGVRFVEVTASTPGPVGASGRSTLALVGKVSTSDVLRPLLSRGVDLGRARLTATGAITTPYGSARLPE